MKKWKIYVMRIELTNEIVKAIEFCPYLDEENGNKCRDRCPLINACYEYWTGDDQYNKDEEDK